MSPSELQSTCGRGDSVYGSSQSRRALSLRTHALDRHQWDRILLRRFYRNPATVTQFPKTRGPFHFHLQRN